MKGGKGMPYFHVTWDIDVIANNAEQAAIQAEKIRDDLLVSFYKVIDEDGNTEIIDLMA